MSARSPFSRCRPKARRVSAPKPGPGSRGNKPCAFFPLMGKDAQPQGARRGRLSLLVQPYHRAEQRDRDRDKSDPAPRHEADIVDIMAVAARSEEHTSELQSLMRISYAVFCLKKKKKEKTTETSKYK